MNIRDKFKKLRELKGVTQLSLATLSGLSNGMICRYEQGRNDLSVDNLIKLLDALDATPAELFADDTHHVPIVQTHDLVNSIGTITKQGDYAACYAVVNDGEKGLFPDNSLSIVSPVAEAVKGDVVAIIGDSGKLHFERYRSSLVGRHCGVVISTCARDAA